MPGNVVEIVIGAQDLTGPAFAGVLARAEALKAAMKDATRLDLAGSNVDVQLSQLRSKLQAYKIADLLDINMNQGQIEGQLMLLKRQIEAAGISDLLDIGASTSQVEEAVAKVKAEVDAQDLKLRITPDVSALPPGIGIPWTAGLGGTVIGSTPGPGASSAGAAAGGAAAGGAGSAAGNGNGGGGVAAGLGAAAGGAAAGGGGGAWAFLGKDVALFGGALGALPLIGTVTGLHLVADAVLETTAVVVPATIAMVGWGAAAVPTVKAMYEQMKTLHTVATAFGTQIPGLSGGFSKLAAAVKPQVYALWGDALTIMNNKTGIFAQTVKGAGVVIDRLASRFTLAVTSGHGFGGFLAHADSDLAKLGDIIGNLGGTFGNLFKAMPGYAQMLLTLVDNGTKLLEWASAVAEPILKVGLAMHGALLYGGLLTTGLSRLVAGGTFFGKQFGGLLPLLSGWAEKAAYAASGSAKLGVAGEKAGQGLLSIATGAESAAKLPWGWIATATVALGFLVYEILKAGNANDQLMHSIQNNIAAQTSWYGMVDANAAAMANLGHQVRTTTDAFSGLGSGLGAAIVTPAQASSAATKQLSSDTKTLTGSYVAQTARMMDLSVAFGSVGAAQGAVTATGMKLGQLLTENGTKWREDLQTLQGYVQATVQLAGFQGGPALAAQNALNFAQNAQYQAIQQITQDQTAYIQLLTSGESAFTTFATDLQSISKAAHAAHASIGGLNANSLTLAGDYWSTLIPAAQAQISALENQQVSTGNLTKAVGDIGAQLVTFAGHNTAARAAVVGLINNALGPGTVSLKTLNGWLKTNGGSLADLKKIEDQATVATSKLASSVTALANAAFAKAIFQASGFSGTIKTLAYDMVHNKTSVSDLQPVYNALVSEFEQSGMKADAARQKASQLISEYGKVPKSVLTTLAVNDKQALAVIGYVEGLLGALGKSVTTGIVNIYDYVHTLKLPPGKAAGGVIGAASGGSRSGWTLVGEHGPELAQLPAGSTVHSNPDTQRMMSGGSGGWCEARLEVTGSGAHLIQAIAQDIKLYVRSHGGGGANSVQRAFGAAW